MIKHMLSYFVVSNLIIITSLNAAAPDTIWTKTYGGSQWDWARSVRECSDNGYIITGGSWSFNGGLGKSDVYAVRTNSSGDTVWTKTYGNDGYDEGYCVQKCSGGFIIAGETEGDYPNVYLLKINDFEGDSVWAKTYGGNKSDYGKYLQVCSNGDFLIVGHTNSFGAGKNDIYLLRIDAFGDTVWTRTYGGTEDDYGYCVDKYDNGQYIIAGATKIGTTYSDIYLIRVNSSGDTVWTKTYGGNDDDCAYSVKICDDEGLIITGFTRIPGTGEQKVYLLRTDSLGDSVWSRTYSQKTENCGYCVEECADGGFIISGYTASAGGTWEDIYIIKTNSSGDTMWTQTYGKNGDDRGYCVQQISSEGFLIGGQSEFMGEGMTDMYLIKTGAVGIENKIDNTERLKLTSSPNPFSGGTVIYYSIANNGFRVDNNIFVLNMAGRIVKTFPNIKGEGSISWAGKDNKGTPLTTGIYFLKIKTGNNIVTNKLTILR